MRVKTFVGKDPALIERKRKPKHAGPIVCRNCGDDLSRGYCIKCRAAMQVYRDVDAAKVVAFQRARGVQL